MAEAMPEDKYSFKTTERQKIFQEQLMHIKQNMDWLSTTYFSKDGKKTPNATYTTKAEVITAIKEAFDNTAAIIKNASPEELKEVVAFFAGPKTKLQILNLLQDHVTHHRGQIIVYLNLNDLKPTIYRGWQTKKGRFEFTNIAIFQSSLLFLKSYGHQSKIQETCGRDIHLSSSTGSAGLYGGLPPCVAAIVDFLMLNLSKLTFFFFII